MRLLTIYCISARFIAKQIRLKYNKYFDKSTYHRSRINKTWLMCFPSDILHLILIRLDSFSLVQLSRAFSQLKNIIIKPIYWYDLNIILDEAILSSNELIMLTNYLKPIVEKICIRIRLLNCKNTVDEMIKKRLLNHENVKKLQIYHFNKCSINIKQMSQFSHQMTHLNIRYFKLSNQDLIQITDIMTCVESLYIDSFKRIDNGLEYFLSKVKNLKEFGFNLPSTTNKYAFIYINRKVIFLRKFCCLLRVFRFVYERHRMTITYLRYGLYTDPISESVLIDLPYFPNLKHLCLHYTLFPKNSYEIFNRIKSIEYLKISCHFTQDVDVCLLTNPLKKLKNLEMRNFFYDYLEHFPKMCQR